jgi:exoribonuclease R
MEEYGVLEYIDTNYYVNGKIVMIKDGIKPLLHDTVYINNDNDNNHFVVGIKERSKETILGILYLDSKTIYSSKNGAPRYIFKPLNRIYPNFFVQSSKKDAKNQKYYVKIEFKDWPESDKIPSGMIKDYIGTLGNISSECEALRCYYSLDNVSIKIPKEKINEDIKHVEEIDDIDYTIFSIDPPGSNDIDDAFHFKFNPDKNQYEIGVHIASPAYFLSGYMDDILKKVSTVYLPMKKYNMLPPIYSENILSLLEGKKRRALSIIYTFEYTYNIVSYEIKSTKVFNEKNFTYEEFDKKQMNKNPSPFVSFSKNFFNDDEINSHKLVEKWMIYTNEKIAAHLIENYSDKNIIIRSQEKSSVKPIELDDYLYICGEKSAKYDLYSADKESSHSHYRLNLQIYTHFTSPIRRAVDFYVHSLLLGIESSLSKEHIQEYIENINKFTKSNRKFQRKVDRICFLANIKNADKHIETMGYIIEIKNDKYIRVYILEYKLEEKIYCTNMADNIMYKLYDKINIRLYVFLLNDNIFDKLKIEIV